MFKGSTKRNVIIHCFFDMLAGIMNKTHGFETWEPDRLPASLDSIGEWFATQVEKRERTEEEIREIKSRLTFPMDIPKDEWTDRTFSLAVDIGMYFSQVWLKNSGIKPADIPGIVPARIGRFDMAPFDCRDDD
jgi:hypothetical protein